MEATAKKFDLHLSVLAAIAVSLLGCQGIIYSEESSPNETPEEPGTPETISESAPFACTDARPEDNLEPSGARRLSRRALQRTLVDVFGRFLGTSSASTMVTAALTATALPPDSDRYKRWNNDFSSVHAQSLFELADSLSKNVTSPANYSTFIKAVINLRRGVCTTLNEASPSVDCQKQLIQNLGFRFLRRPLQTVDGTDEGEAYRQEYAFTSGASALSNVVFRMMLAPNSLFHLEANESPYPGRADVLKLSSFSIANRLSYSYWNAPPDDTLLSLAETVDLSSDQGFSQALAHVMSKPASLSDSAHEFFNDWLRLDSVPQFQSNNPTTFAVYAGNVNYSDPNLRSEILSEVRELGAYITTSGGTFEDLFTTDVSFARGSELMKIYGVTTPAPTEVTAANAVRLPSGRHPGFLTRAAMLVTAAGNKNPVLRGYHIRRDILCLSTPLPPANLPPDAFSVPPFNVNATARERYTTKTSVQPCQGCHAFINPMGDALSNYSGLGKFETTEPAFNEDGTSANKQLNVDSSVDLLPVLGTPARTTNPVEFSSLLSERVEAKRCFLEAYGSFLLNRAVASNDGCRLNKMYGLVRARKPLKDVMQSLVQDPEFRMRKL
jgi:hypothetical protein